MRIVPFSATTSYPLGKHGGKQGEILFFSLAAVRIHVVNRRPIFGNASTNERDEVAGW
jgi:hypothetical protein